MAKPTSGAISINNATESKSVSTATGPRIGPSGTPKTNLALGRYPVANMLHPSRDLRSRFRWGVNTTQSGVQSDALRVVVDCGEPVAAESIGLVDCNAKQGRVRFIGSNTKEILDAYPWNATPSSVTSADQDAIYYDIDLEERNTSGVNVEYTQHPRWASRSQLDWFNRVSVPSDYPLLNTSAHWQANQLRGDSDSTLTDTYSDLCRSWGIPEAYSMPAKRPHQIRTGQYTNRSGTTYADLWHWGDDVETGSEEQFNSQARGKPGPVTGRKYLDRNFWIEGNTGAGRSDAQTQAEKPVGYIKTDPHDGGLISNGSGLLRRDNDAAVGGAYFIATQGIRLNDDTTNGSNYWCMFIRNNTNPSGVFVMKGVGASGTIRVQYWNIGDHASDNSMYWDVPDSLVGGWHVWQIICRGGGTEYVELVIDGTSYGQKNPTSTSSFGAINIYAVGGRFDASNLQTQISSPVPGPLDVAFMSVMSWGYALSDPNGSTALTIDAKARYQEASFDIGTRTDDLKRRYWAIEFDELRSPVSYNVGSYLQIGTVWVGERIDIAPNESSSIESSSPSSNEVAESFSGTTYQTGTKPTRIASVNAQGSTMADSASLARRLNDTTTNSAIADLHVESSSSTSRCDGLMFGTLPGAKPGALNLGNYDSSRVSVQVIERKAPKSYATHTQPTAAGWSFLRGEFVTEGSVIGAPVGGVAIFDTLLETGKNAMMEIAVDSTHNCVGPRAGFGMYFGIIKDSYVDGYSGAAPVASDWVIASNLITVSPSGDPLYWSGGDGSVGEVARYIVNGAVANTTGTVFSNTLASGVYTQNVGRHTAGGSNADGEPFAGGPISNSGLDTTVNSTNPTAKLGSELHGRSTLAVYWYNFFDTYGVTNIAGYLPRITIGNVS